MSGFAGSHNVASMVVFVDAKPSKKDYRLYKIKTVTDKNDDYASMREAVYRRYSKAENLPDLIFADGGAGHVHTVKEVLDGLNLNIPVFGIFKDDKHNTHSVMSENGEVKIDKTSEAFMLFGKYSGRNAPPRDNVLPFVKPKKSAVKSELDNISGVGERRRKRPYAPF
ncbi:MAG: hypothetical protein L6V93_07590 [Clostridiales bacterium]|nr:MAG: hypothetical protein L6V93_07590 [Clostridiales bacterium]